MGDFCSEMKGQGGPGTQDAAGAEQEMQGRP